MLIKLESHVREKAEKVPQVERVPLPERHQHGKHQDLMREVLKQLKALREDWAVKIELLGMPAKTLRSAIFRAASIQGIEITSFSDSNHLYILRKLPAMT